MHLCALLFHMKYIHPTGIEIHEENKKIAGEADHRSCEEERENKMRNRKRLNEIQEKGGRVGRSRHPLSSIRESSLLPLAPKCKPSVPS